MNIKVCFKCGKHNHKSAWSCTDCGETLSIKTLVDANDTQLLSEIQETIIRQQIKVNEALKLNVTTQNEITAKEEKCKIPAFLIYIISALLTNYMFSVVTVGLVIFGFDKMGSDIGSPGIALFGLLFINGILSIIAGIIMGIAKFEYKKEFSVKSSVLIFLFTYFPFHITGLYIPEKHLGFLAEPLANLFTIMMFFSYIPFFHMIAQGLINMYEFFNKKKV